MDNNKYQTIGVVAYSKYYIEYRDSLSKALNNYGWTATVFTDIVSSESCDIIIVVGMAFFSNVPYLKNKILIGIQGEQLPLPGDNDWSLKRTLKRYKSMAYFYDLVIEWSPLNYINHNCSVPRTFISFGAPNASNKSKREEWDVVFLGNPYGGKGRRLSILNRVKKEFKLYPIMEAWGEKKFELLNSAKICLNLHQYESLSYESPRIFELLAEGVFILSEPISNSFPFEDGEHFVSFKNENELLEKARYYCDNPNLRNEIARKGKEKANAYKQEIMFGLISVEIERAIKGRRSEFKRIYSWLKAIIGNSSIEFIDNLAKMKNKILLQLKKSGKTN
jgi:hypothetical protein